MIKRRSIIGIHHVTAMTSDAEKNYHFFTDVLGIVSQKNSESR